MPVKKKHLLYDLALVSISIFCAIALHKTGLAERFVSSFEGNTWLAVFVAGLFFSSAFTTAPSIVLLGTLAATTPLPLLVVLGGFGAMLGDYIIFLFVKDRITGDFEYLLSHTKRKRFFAIFRTKVFRFFVPFIGALIIASPFPDEIGVAILGLSKVKSREFFLISFFTNCAGILVIGLVARAILS